MSICNNFSSRLDSVIQFIHKLPCHKWARYNWCVKIGVSISVCHNRPSWLFDDVRNLMIYYLVYCYLSIVSNNCPEGFTSFQDSCYKVYQTLLTRCDADLVCSQQNGHLADITSHEEHQFVTNLLSKEFDIRSRSGKKLKYFNMWLNTSNRTSWSEVQIWLLVFPKMTVLSAQFWCKNLEVGLYII